MLRCRRTTRLLALWLWAGAAVAQPPAPPAAEETVFRDEIVVHLQPLAVRVTDTDGRAVRGLGRGDFRVTVGGVPIPLEAVDWVPGGGTWLDTVPPETWERLGLDRQAVEALEDLAEEQARYLVVLVQADVNAPRIRGHLRLLPYLRRMLAELPPEMEVAVVGFDSHLKLFADFGLDRDASWQAIWRAVHFGAKDPILAAEDGGDLARGFDFAAAKDAGLVEQGLEVVARALEPLPGRKLLVFAGHGVGNHGWFGVTQNAWAYRPAVAALHEAGVTVHALKTHAGSLAGTFAELAHDTGGTFGITELFPGQEIGAIVGQAEGYYVLLLDGEAVPPGGGRVGVELVEPAGRWRLHVPPVELRSPAAD